MRDFSQIIVELMENKELENFKLKFQLGLQGAKCSKDSSGLRRLTLHYFLGLFIIALLTPLDVIFIYYLPSIKGVHEKNIVPSHWYISDLCCLLSLSPPFREKQREYGYFV